jgi:Ser/Thr protein kinase RdoA (MazF antagonist)
VTARRLPSGTRSAVWLLDGPHGAVVVKLAPPEAVAHEAAVLGEIAGLGVGPRLVAAGGGALVLEALPGATRDGPPAAADARTLGALVRRVHDSRAGDAGEWPGWDGRERDLGRYRARIAETVAAWAAPALRVRADAVLAALPPLPEAGPAPFRRLHGDLWSGNVVWDGATPTLVDWEYGRQGDPAEELAYLVEMDAYDDDALAALLAGYGAPDVAARVDAWRPLVALAAGLWYAEEGVAERAEALLAQAAARVGLRSSW